MGQAGDKRAGAEQASDHGRAAAFARARPRRERGQPLDAHLDPHKDGAGGPGRGGATFLFGHSPLRSLVSPEWWHMALPMALGIGTLLLTDPYAGGWLHPMLAALGALLTLPSRVIAPARRRSAGDWTHLALAGPVIVVPMALYGWAIGHWAAVGGLPWLQAHALLVTITLVASAIQSGRQAGLLAAQVALWAGVTSVMSTLAGVLVTLIGVVVAAVAFAREQQAEQISHARRHDEAREQARAQEILSDFEETGQGWFWETDRRGHLLYLSPTVAELLGRSAEDMIGRRFTDLFDLDEQGTVDPETPGQSARGERTLTFHLSARSSFSDLVVRAATREEERWWSIAGRPIYDTFDNFQGFRGSGADLTERRRSQEYASRLAHFDSLTGLSNRFSMAQSLEKILLAPQEQQRACAIFLIDLDRFKHVNDTLGHPAGDQLLKQVAQRLEIGVGRAGRVGRLGGDEFKIIFPGRLDRKLLAQVAAHVIDTISQPYTIEGSRVMIGASVGIAIAPDDGVTSEALIRNADLALYAAKDGGRGRYHFYAPDLHSDAEERRQIEEELREAIGRGQLELYYQPVVQTTTEKITGFEALLRWNHPERGFISPGKFIPIAEDTGLIAPIGEWALRKACEDLATWPENVRVAVNVSALQFANPGLPALVASALAHAGVDPDRLELEITESVFIDSDDHGSDTMFRALKAIGVRLALDDFGTGFSSLGYLKRAPFDKIKIDQSFVRGATQPGSRNGAIIASIVSLAEALGMETTAEGVETFDELELVRLLGCSHIQGYIYERPLSGKATVKRLASGLVAVAHGPRAARAMRLSLLRRVTLEHGGHSYEATVRNISQTGALIEGLRHVPAGTIFRVQLADGHVATATAKWSEDDRLGVEFSIPLELDETGRIQAISNRARPRAAPAVPAGATIDVGDRRAG